MILRTPDLSIKKCSFILLILSIFGTWLLWSRTSVVRVNKFNDIENFQHSTVLNKLPKNAFSSTMAWTKPDFPSSSTNNYSVYDDYEDDDDLDEYMNDNDMVFVKSLNQSKYFETMKPHNQPSLQEEKFNINDDVIVFLHIQKTGGTFLGRMLTRNLNLSRKCEADPNYEKRKFCLRPNSTSETWLFSRYSTGWICGLHADWLNLQNCVPRMISKNDEIVRPHRYFYITILRDPVARFVSEWSHVKRGATWRRKSVFICNGTNYDPPNCYPGYNWAGVSLDDFLSCPFNLAHNRQTRMLANLSLCQCYDLWMNKTMTSLEREKLERAMLDSAKKNLEEMVFFSLLENQKGTRMLFESAFGINFIENSEIIYSKVKSTLNDKTPEQIERIKKLNYLDVELYEFAKELFQQRLDSIK